MCKESWNNDDGCDDEDDDGCDDDDDDSCDDEDGGRYVEYVPSLQ